MAFLATCSVYAEDVLTTLPLNGTWTFRLDGENVGSAEEWFALEFDDTADSYRPTVQVIDNFVRNHKLGLIAETRVDKGKMLICAIDLLGHQDKPEARQLLHSLLRYAGSRKFAPRAEIGTELLNKLFPGNTQ